MSSATASPAAPAFWRARLHRFVVSSAGIITGFALLKFALQLAAIANYGYHRDELYYLDCADHLAAGYPDHAPLIAFITYAFRAALGDSLPAIRLFPALAGVAKVVLTGMLALRLGAQRFGVALACLCIVIAPIYLGIDNFLSMNALEPVLWMTCVYLLLRMIQGGSVKLWLWFGLVGGIGIENKHSTLLFGLVLVLGLLATPQRVLLKTKWFWLGGAIAFLLFLPNLLWQVRNDWATLELLHNVSASGRTAVSGLDFLIQQVVLLNPLTVIIWMGGLAWLLVRPAGRPYRALGIAYVLLLFTMMLLHGKNYYVVPVYPVLFAAGAVAREEYITEAPERRRWMRPGALIAISLAGLLSLPVALPVLPPETVIRYSQVMHISPPNLNTPRVGRLQQQYADMFGWPELTATVAGVYHSLPPAERARAAIYASDYGEAGAIDFFGPGYGLPKVISGNQSYWIWGPRDYTGDVLIIVGEAREQLAPHCGSVEVAAAFHHVYARPYENGPILLCRGLKRPLSEIWPRLRRWD